MILSLPLSKPQSIMVLLMVPEVPPDTSQLIVKLDSPVTLVEYDVTVIEGLTAVISGLAVGTAVAVGAGVICVGVAPGVSVDVAVGEGVDFGAGLVQPETISNKVIATINPTILFILTSI